jgi:hypothetical protein
MAAAGLTGPNPTALALEAVPCPKGDESVSLGSDLEGFFGEVFGEVEVQLEEFESQVVEKVMAEKDCVEIVPAEGAPKDQDPKSDFASRFRFLATLPSVTKHLGW